MIDCGCDEILLPQGSDGVNGKNAYTVTTAQFVQPGIGNSITINVSDSLQNTNQWAIAGQIIKITDSVGNGGWYRVTGITGTTQITATQLDYPGTSGSAILVGAGVSPAGLQGPAGDPGTQGGLGLTGPPNSLSIPPGNVTTLDPGSDATATILGDAPNQTLSLGIPRGNPGLAAGTVPYRSWNNSTITIGTTYTTLFYGGIEGGVYQLCENIGDSFRINFSANAYVGRFDTVTNALDFQFSLGTASTTAVILEPPLYSPPSDGLFNNTAPVDIPVSGNSLTSTGAAVIYISANIFVQRVSSNNFFYQFQWSATNLDRAGGSLSNVYSGVEAFTFGSLPANYKEFRVTARRRSVGSTVTTNMVSVTIENLKLA